ncbi:hypothetical protein [Parabacteroides sp. AM08-6]|uniref:hypothetical protein n=1 Tax=Parabacteroides sp. AM08-6 TaxID=2292053 RepID=UPI000F00D0E5|nr:hypothetical protein [Parabacteroides sp. AM08-6]RHJ83532.1 hypothetical protein DW103_07345 [Parabacteroides sp. AM08-6]
MKDIKKILSVMCLFAILCLICIAAGIPADSVVCAGFAPVLWPAGNDNMGGYKGRVAFIPENSVSKTPLLPAKPAETTEFVTASGAFEFIKTGEKPTPIYATRATVGYKSEIQGETDCKSYKITGEFFHPGKKVEAAAFARQVCNTPGYLIIEDSENQQLVGQPGYPCMLAASFDGGKAPADKRGWSFTFEADSPAPMIIMGTPIDLDELFTGVASTPDPVE